MRASLFASESIILNAAFEMGWEWTDFFPSFVTHNLFDIARTSASFITGNLLPSKGTRDQEKSCGKWLVFKLYSTLRRCAKLVLFTYGKSINKKVGGHPLK